MSSSGKNSVSSPNTPSGSKHNSSTKKSAQLDDRTRLKRNAGEKKRRDKLNNYISELSSMVPSCRMPQSQRKLDKSTILKLTVSYMKLHADLLPESVEDTTLSWRPSFLSNEELGQLMLEALDGFLFVIWSTGRTIYISESITPLLGHLQQELVGKNFLELVHPEDMAMVRDRMFPNDTDNGYIEELSSSIHTPSPPHAAPSPSSTSSDTPSYLRRNFITRMRRGGFSGKTEYEVVSCSGHLRRWDEVTRNSSVETTEMLPLDGYCLVGVGRLQCTQVIREMTPSVPSINAWTSHHSLDAKYIHIDQNASPILGYTAAELLGSSAYNFYHDEDLNTLARSHVDLNKSGSGDTSLYRFLTKGQQWLWVKTRGLVKYQEGTKEPSSIITHNIVVSYAEVWQYLQNKARQYGPEERNMLAPKAPPPTTVATNTKVENTTSPTNAVKVEQFSPRGPSVYGESNCGPLYYNPSQRKEPGTPHYYTPPTPPNLVAFTSSTQYVVPPTSQDQFAQPPPNSFNDLFPGYKPPASTEERHGAYRGAPVAGVFNSAPGCQYGESYPTYNGDVKPVYIQHHHQPQQLPGQFLQTISSPPNGAQPHGAGPTGAPVTPPNMMVPTYHPTTTAHHPVTAPNVLVAKPPNVIIMGQPQGYNYMSSHEVPNVTLRSLPVHTEEPVVGMPVTTGYTVTTQHAPLHTPLSTAYHPAPRHNNNTVTEVPRPAHSSPRKGVSVYSSGPEKRCPSPGSFNSCAQVSMKRLRNEAPAPEGVVPGHVNYNTQYYGGGPYQTPAGHPHHAPPFHTIDTGQHTHKQT